MGYNEWTSVGKENLRNGIVDMRNSIKFLIKYAYQNISKRKESHFPLEKINKCHGFLDTGFLYKGETFVQIQE